ncbi:type I restriction endonuclease [Streptosporangium sp. NBC_01755]|uniref:type I restriction endonuclease subunit R n=1 Tax=unclassified Streptosporangium TaxID=2632669 RepID=UPI002DD839D8|nr:MULTISPECIES: type I restriction endonuclease [unclassified Streptosporangium]WSA27220.1 type I restriction endonuclease [Streptosporangium sp. NBC_01810]WSD01227.1 type I restriction endonuclease [Streptosporangium sp. NBC_01755]
MSPVHHEKVFEDAIESALRGAGWLKGVRGAYDRTLGLNTTELLDFVRASQRKEWERLVTMQAGDDAGAAQRLADTVAKAIDNEGALEVLRHGVKDRGITFKLAYFRPAHTIAADALEPYSKNILSVVRQLRYSETTQDELDLVLFVNGIPVATAELKNTLTGTTVEDAKEQYRRTRDPKEPLFARRTLVHFAVDQDLVFVTTRLAREKTRFLPFNTGDGGPGNKGGAGNPRVPLVGDYRTAYLWQEIWAPDTWMDLLKRFLHVDDEDVRKGRGRKTYPGKAHRLPMIFPRYHQWHAVREMTAHARRHGSGHNYLVEHSAGSGKSNTIAWLAHALSNLHTSASLAEIDPEAIERGYRANQPVFDKVIVITDRVVLDRQLQETIYQFEHTPGVVKRIDQDAAQLAEALQGESARIVITTLQKFPHVLQQVEGLRGKRFAVIVDEAHSSQSGEGAAALKRVLRRLGSDDVDEDGNLLTASALARGRHETLSYFAFTATPKSKTLTLFGTPGSDGKPRAFHIYSMRQAIEEGFILDVLKNYVTYKTLWRLMSQEPEDRQVQRRKGQALLARFAELHPTSMQQRAQIIVEHFRRHTAPQLGGRSKAMVVTRSREHALRLGQAIRDYVETNGYAGCGTLIAFSQTLKVTDEHGVETEYTEAGLNGFGEKELPDRFAYCRADDSAPNAAEKAEYRILVVADKYQTGFDQPLLTTMYVDKKLAGVAAVQTLSRLNRTHRLKSQGDVFVLDFANEAEDIQAEFQPYFEGTAAETIDPNLLYTRAGAVAGHALLVESEMQALTEAYLRAERASATQRDWEKAHAALYRFTEPAVARFVERQGQDKESDDDSAERFRGDLQSFVRMYGFLSQVVPYTDDDLERLYLFGRFLLNRLPRREDPAVDVGEIDLTHLKIAKTGEHDVSLSATPGGEVTLPAPSGAGGVAAEPEMTSLHALIAAVNDKYGLGLSEADQVWVEQQFEEAVVNDSLKAAALVNDEANFGEVFADHLEKVVVDRHTGNTGLVQRFFDDSLFRSRITELGRKQVYKMIRESTGIE